MNFSTTSYLNTVKKKNKNSIFNLSLFIDRALKEFFALENNLKTSLKHSSFTEIERGSISLFFGPMLYGSIVRMAPVTVGETSPSFKNFAGSLRENFFSC